MFVKIWSLSLLAFVKIRRITEVPMAEGCNIIVLRKYCRSTLLGYSGLSRILGLSPPTAQKQDTRQISWQQYNGPTRWQAESAESWYTAYSFLVRGAISQTQAVKNAQCPVGSAFESSLSHCNVVFRLGISINFADQTPQRRSNRR